MEYFVNRGSWRRIATQTGFTAAWRCNFRTIFILLAKSHNSPGDRMNARPGRQVSNGEESRLAFQLPLCKAAMMILPAFTWESGLGWDPNLCALVRPRPLFSGLSCSSRFPIQPACLEGVEEEI